MPNRPKRPRDPAQLAKLTIDIASGEVTEGQPTAKQTRARKAGAKGGPARARALSPEQRSEIARAAAEARWKKSYDRRAAIVAQAPVYEQPPIIVLRTV